MRRAVACSLPALLLAGCIDFVAPLSGGGSAGVFSLLIGDGDLSSVGVFVSGTLQMGADAAGPRRLVDDTLWIGGHALTPTLLGPGFYRYSGEWPLEIQGALSVRTPLVNDQAISVELPWYALPDTIRVTQDATFTVDVLRTPGSVEFYQLQLGITLEGSNGVVTRISQPGVAPVEVSTVTLGPGFIGVAHLRVEISEVVRQEPPPGGFRFTVARGWQRSVIVVVEPAP